MGWVPGRPHDEWATGCGILADRLRMDRQYTREELQQFRRLSSPERIQEFLDLELAYNKEPDGPSCRSPRRVLRDRVAHCMEGALMAAAALEQLGHPPVLLDLEAVRDDDHVVALYRQFGCWGAIAKSNYAGLRFRTPVYATIRELALSYFEHYYNPRGEKTLRTYSKPVSLGRFPNWRTSEEDVWEVPTYLADLRHYPILPARANGVRFRMDRRLFEAGKVGAVGLTE